MYNGSPHWIFPIKVMHRSNEALAATADFSKYVLCHAEPACHVADLASNVRGRFIEYGVSALTSLYRAWELKI